MKLESLNDSKFEAFKGMEVKNPLMVVGGGLQRTMSATYGNGQTTYGEDMWRTDVHAYGTAQTTYKGNSGDMVDMVLGAPRPEWSDPSFEVEFEFLEVIE